MDIQIERYESPKVDVYKANGDLVGTLNNYHEFNRFRINMVKHNVTDNYYFMWGEVKITVDTNGVMDKFPAGLYDQLNRDISELWNLTNK